ncbi:SusC/RagA family TonB-linked outer membrane protein [Flavobacterium silvaticum]|uniref:SusC/RagA family TonB-linked outer membrane protein n=1 Tax=Flavobacterium silvaticum TaxID=1852020 RepID=A0A972FJE7_9FLAO|nr:SusC/RagA family TonB-linked outer membrane protein [Flavobacterium silvaticum]NMH27159.1 SusC/RagA family TonB-linked outer membrane protein [Flavobacterium silvaticum]
MKTIYKKLLFILLLMPFAALAQGTLSGTVLEKGSNLPLPGVNVVVKGTTNGTSTDIDGKFQLRGLTNGNVLVFSYIGFADQDITYTGQTTLSVTMSEGSNQLQEVVVQVGYGGVRKKDITGAVSKVSAENLNQGTLTDPIQALQGKAAGVTITKQGGNPNDGFNVRIRGAAGFAANGGPLFVVDGVRGVDPTTIAPEDILSYDVLKDAASTAIYGADGANGVIFITTKKGKAGKTTIEYNTYLAVDKVANRLKLASSDQYRNFATDHGIAFTDNGGNTNWQDELYRTGTSNNHNLSISGGTENTNYRASVSHMDLEGVIRGSQKGRTIGRMNVTQKSFDNRLTIDMGLSATVEHNNYVNYGSNNATDVLFQSFQRLPTDPVYNEDGTFFETNSTFNYYNPVASRSQVENTRDAKRFNGNLNVDYELFKGLNAKVALSYIRNDSESTYFEPRYSNFYGQDEALIRRGYGRRNYDNYEQKLIETTLTYKKTFGENHNLTALIGHSYRASMSDGFRAQGNDPVSNSLGADNLQNFETLLLGDITSYKNERKDVGYFARIMYDYASKYYITGMIRRDGSSVFGANNRYGNFPSVQVAWNVANENFVKNNIPALNLFKLRASWGLSGNSNVEANRSIYRIGPSGTLIDPDTQAPIVNLAYQSELNPDFQWDENEEINLGADFGLFDNRITGSFEYYRKDLKDLLSVYPTPSNGTYLSPIIYVNGGRIKNEGIEATLNAEIVKGGNFSWNTTVTYSSNKQKVETLDSSGGFNLTEGIRTGYISGPGLVGVSTQLLKAGYELGTFYGYEYAGVSDGRWLVRGADNQLHFFDEVNQDLSQRKVIGNALPDFEMGWSNYFKYKNWDLSMAFRAVVGHDIYNATNQVFGNPDNIGSRNVNDEAFILSGNVNGAYQALSYYIEDGSFIKMDNVNLGYNFKNPSFSKYISNLRVYASMNNVFTLTNYGGIDPEVNFSGGNGTNEIYFGIDQYNIYPKTRTVTFGLNVTF